jgi:hypothetical protein
MNRGFLSSISELDPYSAAPKRWYVNLSQTSCFWYDLVVNPPSRAESSSSVKSYLTALKKQVEESLEKRFIYMYGARKKLRFDTREPLSKTLLRRQTQVNVLVGRDQRRVSIPCDLSGLGVKSLDALRFEATDRLICLSLEEGPPITIAVHDFMQLFAATIDEPTEIHYVGLTKNPHLRPLGREHRGYSDMVYGVGSEDHDFFLYVSLFKAMVKADHRQSGLHFLMSNAVIDDIDVQREGELIEGAFIAYFDSKYQNEGGAGERAKLKSLLQRIKAERNIEEIVFDFEVEPPSPYYRFFSRGRSPADRHVFRCCADGDQLTIDVLPSSFDAVEYFSP